MPGRFTVFLTASFRRDLEALPAPVQRKIVGALRGLEASPKGPDPNVKKLKGVGAGQWRLRVGQYRVRYDVTGQEVALYRVRHRREIYRG